MSIKATSGAKYRQDVLYGSDEWHRRYSRPRNSVESFNSYVKQEPTLRGMTNSMVGTSSGIQLYAGLFDDPFFIDLQQFFRIVPDRRPSRGPLSKFPDPATSFRNPGKDFLRGFNALGIVIELPEDMLLPANAATDPAIGIWATTSR